MLPRTPEHLGHQVAVAQRVELEPAVAVGHVGRHRLDGGDGVGGQAERDPGRGRRPAGQHLATRPVEAGEPGGAEHQRQGHGPAEQRRREPPLADVDADARHQLPGIEGAAIVAQGGLVARTAVDEVEHQPGQPAPRGGAQILDGDAAADGARHLSHR